MQRRRTAPRQALPDNRLPHLPSSLLTIPWRHAPLNLCQRWRLLQQKGALAITLWLLATLALAALLWGIDQVAGHLGLAIGIILTVAIATLIGGVAVLGEQYWFDYLKGLDELKKSVLPPFQAPRNPSPKRCRPPTIKTALTGTFATGKNR